MFLTGKEKVKQGKFMQKYDDLWQAIEVRVRENNDITLNDWTTDSVRGHAARQRIAQIFILEVLLARHRDKYASNFVPLAGEEALYHLIFKRTGWKPFEVKQLSFIDTLFVLAELFRDENLPTEVRAVLRSQGIKDEALPTYDFSEKDWAPRENEVFLRR
ncbi:hypothetical protein ABZS17G119_02076 [Kosakonia cowanii]